MSDLSDIRFGLATAIEAALASQPQPPMVYAYPRASMNPPCVIVLPDTGQKGRGAGGKRKYLYHLSLVIAYPRGADDAFWQERLDEYLSPVGDYSLEAVIESESTVLQALDPGDSSRYCDLMWVTGFDSYGMPDVLTVGDQTYPGARLLVDVEGKAQL